ncbi:MAG: TIM-barrel domain-containing protein [Solirubrobacterales bacterium]
MARRVLTIALAILSAHAAPAAAETIESGRLAADVEGEPWGMTFSQPGEGAFLEELAATGSGPSGTLGFSTELGWFHATSATSLEHDGAALIGTLATTDPLGRTIEVRVEPDSKGVIRVAAEVKGPLTADVEATGIGFAAGDGDRYLGFGERSNAVDQRGGEVQNYVSDGPYQSEEYPFLNTFVPPWGLRAREDSTYFPMPWLLSSAGWGVLVENAEESTFRLGSDTASAWSLEANAPRLAFRVFAGPDPADVLRRLTRHTGRQPRARAPWFFGPWYQPHDGGDEHAQAAALREGDVPGSVANTYTHYLPCGDQQGAEAAQVERAAGFHAAGYAVTTYFNPMVCADYSPVYEQAEAAGLLTENAAGDPYNYRYSANTDDLFLVGQFDFANPEAREFYGGLLDEAVGHGYDGWMEDFGEYTPPDSRSHGDTTGATMHNRYPVLYHRASWEYAKGQERPIAGFIRSGWTGVHRYAQLVWGGDPTTSFGFDGLRSAVTQALSIGTSGISRWGSDIGGFFALGFNKLSPELLTRWIELGAVSGVMRTEANGVGLPPRDRPQITDPDVLPTWRRYAKLRTQLYPYLRAADRAYRRTGMPLMRHLALTHPDDPEAVSREDEFMVGPDLLAAPVLEGGATERTAYLPAGKWIDLWRAVSYREAGGRLRLRGAELIGGGAETTVPAPLEEIPLFAKAGTLLPLLPPDVDTLAPYGDEPGLVHLGDARRRREVLAFPRGRSSARGAGRTRLRSTEGDGLWRLRLDGNAGTRYRIQASMASLRDPFEVCEVSLDGEALDAVAWSYGAATRALRVRAKARGVTTRLTARAC